MIGDVQDVVSVDVQRLFQRVHLTQEAILLTHPSPLVTSTFITQLQEVLSAVVQQVLSFV